MGMTYSGASSGAVTGDPFTEPWPSAAPPPQGPEYHFLYQEADGTWAGYGGATSTDDPANIQHYGRPEDYKNGMQISSRWCRCRTKK